MIAQCNRCKLNKAIERISGIELCGACYKDWEDSKITLGELLDLKEIANKRIYQRVCKRCGIIYRSHARTSKFCSKCYNGSQFKKVFGELSNGK